MMKTVKEVAELSGVSVRTLQYYDEIGVFKPTAVSAAGYRLYDDEALKVLQQILFFKELDFPLKEIKTVMESPEFDQQAIMKKQKELLVVKRNRLNRLIELIGKMEKGDAAMSFAEFDLSEYVQVLEEFRAENKEGVIKHWGSEDAFNELIERVKNNEEEIAKMAVEQYGSVEKYAAAIRKNMEHLDEYMDNMPEKKAKAEQFVKESRILMEQLTADLSRDPGSGEVQALVGAMMELNERFDTGMDVGENYWEMIADRYLSSETMISIHDKDYGEGSANFYGRALMFYLKNK